MPFMKGHAPIRRTLEYLKSGQLIFRDNVQIMMINYNTKHLPSRGAKQFVFWHLPHIQYKNPAVQILTFKNLTPSPFFQFILDDGQKVLVDVDGKVNEEIYEHIHNIFCKTAETLDAEAQAKEKVSNPANFGSHCTRWCICEVPGQVPCPAWYPIPKHMRGKYKFQKADDDS